MFNETFVGEFDLLLKISEFYICFVSHFVFVLSFLISSRGRELVGVLFLFM